MTAVTYITPIYKTGSYNISMLYKCLQQQTNKNWFWVIYNDNEFHDSHDSAIDTIKSWNDNRVQFVEREHFTTLKGSGPAKYMAFKKADLLISSRHSEIFCELDHDDLISRDCTQTILDCYYNTSFDFLHANTIVLKNELTPAITNFCKIEEFEHPIFGYKDLADCVFAEVNIENIIRKRITMNIRCYNRFFYKNVGGFDYNVDYGEDFDILIRVACQAKKIVYVPKTLYYYYFNENCSSSKINCDEYFQKIMQKNIGLINMFKNSVTEIIDNNEDYILYKNTQIFK